MSYEQVIKKSPTYHKPGILVFKVFLLYKGISLQRALLFFCVINVCLQSSAI